MRMTRSSWLRTTSLFLIELAIIQASCSDSPLDSGELRSSFPSQLENIRVPSRNVSYLSHDYDDFVPPSQRFAWSSDAKPRLRKPDTTIVLLNWSRLQNVIFQVSVYCGALLQGVVEQVFVWNNQPNIRLEYDKHFSRTGCNTERLRIFNSPSNIYFQARFMACAESHSRYCFLQDDDYITRPEILLNIHASFKNSERTSGNPLPIIFLPSHDHLETDLLRVNVSHPEENKSPLYTSFACLGHGTYLLRSKAADYLSLLRKIGLTSEEMKIADNYFTILSSRIPNTWFAHTIELKSDPGVVPFTVGAAGSERNWKHIETAMAYLEEILHAGTVKLFNPSLNEDDPQSPRYTASCITDPCTLHTNIPMLSLGTPLYHSWSHEDRMRDIQFRRLTNLGEQSIRWYVDHPLSNAVDGDVETAFRSARTVKAGDYVSLTLLACGNLCHLDRHKIAVQLVWLVDANTASTLYTSRPEISKDDISWRPLKSSSLTCFPTTLSLPQDSAIIPPSLLGLFAGQELPQSLFSDLTTIHPSLDLLECHTTFNFVVERNFQIHTRMTAERDRDSGWAIYEAFFRAREDWN